jgi:hypothetical protein
LSDDGLLVNTGTGYVSSLQPGQTGKWDAWAGSDSFDKCHAEVDTVYEG